MDENVHVKLRIVAMYREADDILVLLLEHRYFGPVSVEQSFAKDVWVEAGVGERNSDHIEVVGKASPDEVEANILT